MVEGRRWTERERKKKLFEVWREREREKWEGKESVLFLSRKQGRGTKGVGGTHKALHEPNLDTRTPSLSFPFLLPPQIFTRKLIDLYTHVNKLINVITIPINPYKIKTLIYFWSL